MFIDRQEGVIGKTHITMKKLFTLRLMLIALFAAMSMTMNAETIGDFDYNLNPVTKTAQVKKYKGSATYVVIPENVIYKDVTYRITSLGDWCFNYFSSIVSVNIPSSVTSFGKGCFKDCSSLKSIDVPSSVTMFGAECFRGCHSLTSIVIPLSVTSLGDECFRMCYSLTSIVIPLSVTRRWMF